MGREGFCWDLMGCLGWGYGCLLWNLAGFALSCVFGCEGCGGCVVMVVGCWQMAVDCVDEL